eukprot:11520421-Ditylum_brightwellii.AAC.1
MSTMWKKIGYADKGHIENSIMSISIPDTWPDMSTPILAEDLLENPKTASTWRKVNMPKEIHHYLTVRNQRHFGQAHNTPFTVPLLSQCFDWAANSPMSEAVLQWQFTDTELTDLQQLFLKH